jgi:2-C-methyl-D-erythritol 2,4-cyclodiphosphate synthase
VQEVGYRIVNVDCVISAQEPKLSPYKEALRQQVAAILSVGESQVNIKAKTGEGVGPVGEQITIEARCVALLELI